MPSPYDTAKQRVLDSPLLAPHADILIDYDWPNYDEHIVWVNSASEDDLLAWCKAVKDI